MPALSKRGNSRHGWLKAEGTNPPFLSDADIPRIKVTAIERTGDLGFALALAGACQSGTVWAGLRGNRSPPPPRAPPLRCRRPLPLPRMCARADDSECPWRWGKPQTPPDKQAARIARPWSAPHVSAPRRAPAICRLSWRRAVPNHPRCSQRPRPARSC